MEVQNQIVPRKKTFWKMVKTIFLPAQTIANLMAGCGGGKQGKGKRRLSIRNMHVAKEAFLRASFRRQTNTYRRSVPTTNSVQTSSQIPEPPTENPTAESSSNAATGNTIGTNMPNESLRPRSNADFLDAITNVPELDQSSVMIPNAPINLEQAQLLLESLTLCGSSPAHLEQHTMHDSDQPAETVGVEQLVEVEVEVEISGEDIPSPSSFSDENSFQYEHDHTVNDNNTTNSSSITEPQEVVLRRTPKLSTTSDAGSEFHGWRRSSIEVTSNPPVTLSYIPSGLCVGDRIVWVKEIPVPEIGTVRWIGKIRNQFYSGIEFDKPIGNSSGLYGYGTGLYKQLFSCKLSYGRFVPVKELVLYKDYHDTGIKSGIVCVICRDDFLDTWEPGLFVQSTPANPEIDQHGLQPFHMVSTKCGHLYHWGCLDEWFSTKKRIEYHCPFCVRPMERDEVIRIFPTQI